MSLKSFFLLSALCWFFPAAGQPAREMDNARLMQYFENRQYPEAVSYLEANADTLGRDTKPLCLLGYACYLDNRMQEATYWYGKVLSVDSLNRAANSYLALICLGRKDYPAAIAYYNRLNALVPGNAWYLKQSAYAWLQLQKPDSALKYYRLSYTAGPRDPEVVVALADLLVPRKQYLSADRILDQYLAADSTQMDVISARVGSAFQQERYESIFPFAQRLMAATDISTLVAPLTYLAIAYQNTGRYNSCLKVCHFMILNNAKTETVMYLEGMAFRKLKNYPASLAAFSECIGMAISKSADAYYTEMGEDYEQMHQYRKAIAQYDTAHYIFHDPMRLYNIGRIYEAYLKKPGGALRYYRRYRAEAQKPGNENEKEIAAYVRQRVKELSKSRSQ